MPNLYVPGGGDPFSFNVVGGTAPPSNPRENTIWVNTDVPITKVDWNPSKDSSLQQHGRVNINGAATEWRTPYINVLKNPKNVIFRFPKTVYQYVNGVWVHKEAKIFQGGAWIDIIYYLYNSGDKCTSETGGWTGVKASGGAYNLDGDYMHVGYSGSTGRDAALFTVKKVSTYGFETLKVYGYLGSTQQSNGYGFSIGLSTNNTDATPGSFVASVERFETGVFTMALDIGGYQDSYYIKLQADVSKADVHKVWLE